MKKAENILKIVVAVIVIIGIIGYVGKYKEQSNTVKISLAAAASLEKCYTEKLIPMFEKENPNVKVEGTYDSSGKLQTQIEQGMNADIFMSAATKQMEELIKKDYVLKKDMVYLLENKVVLITSKKNVKNVKADSFETITKADTIAIGDPESVPAGQYAKEIFKKIGNWENVRKKASFGTNVTEVLNWTAQGSADCGVVYATDAAMEKGVKVMAEATDQQLKVPVIYPAATLKNSKHKEAAEKFMEFLKTEEALKVFEDYGFTAVKE